MLDDAGVKLHELKIIIPVPLSKTIGCISENELPLAVIVLVSEGLLITLLFWHPG